MSEEGGGAMPMDGVWKAFDTRAAMIEILAGSRHNKAALGSASVVTPQAQPAAPVLQSAPEPVAAPPVAAAPEPMSAPMAAPDTGASPMSMFASGDTPVKEAPQEVVAEPVAIEDDQYENDDDDGEDDGEYNPMSFFGGKS